MHNPLYRQWRLVQFKRNMSLCWCRVFLPASLGSECSVWVLLCNRETGSPDPSPPPRWGLKPYPGSDRKAPLLHTTQLPGLCLDGARPVHDFH